jgi:hypothetical protein
VIRRVLTVLVGALVLLALLAVSVAAYVADPLA